MLAAALFSDPVKPPAFQLYADDFVAGTMILSQAEVGAYMRLLCAQWSMGGLPDDPAKLERIAGGPVSQDVLAKLPVGPDGMRRNARMELERQKQADFRESRSKAGIIGNQKRWQENRTAIANGSHSDRTAIAKPIANGSHNHRSPSPSPSPVSNLLFPDSKTDTAAPPLGCESDASAWVEKIYQAYPRKAGKPSAIRAIAKAFRTIDPPELFKRVLAYAAARRGASTQFTPHPATWFNDQRFNDDPSTWADAAPKPSSGPKPISGHSEWLARTSEILNREEDDFSGGESGDSGTGPVVEAQDSPAR